MSRFFSMAVACVLGGFLVGCSPTVATRGYIVDNEKLDTLEPGVSTRDDVMNVLGSPSTMGTFDDRVWYYMGHKTEQTSFFTPDVVDRKVVAVTFDDSGVVEGISQLDKDDAQTVELADRRTPTKGREYTILEQFMGNLGRFNPSSKK